ncbi:NAD(P)/FAD-dependent oxidoreductase [Pontibacter qinzhouensis]|uniref:Pyridine nucleotide-disulfide oxidoreductase domain-containing protein 2 n=1 Tax=Pontibacter qinzhouensis TaxID=2603253 RepID=A0A5C8K860_9BACT|nr:NAD(P)/FAD-dependent oxidoreductase [Pontibacter qinzhouensis]TXK49231.1 NAD(P)/FAD-dependent oxidoreductase [Pontibacter qinzhouensis]
MQKYEYDAVVVGSGPNGLAAAITLQHAGLSVLLLEGKSTIGGGLRTAELNLQGFKYDVCSAIHPLAAGSPFFQSLPLQEHGLRYIYPPLAAAHPFDGGKVATLGKSVEETAQQFGQDEKAYRDLVQPLVRDWPAIAPDVLGPLPFPKHPFAMARFGLKALPSALHISKRFVTAEARGLWAGMAAHSIQPLSHLTTSAIGLVLMAAGHLRGWPVPKGGSQSIANALASYFTSLGGKIETNQYIQSLSQLPAAKAVLFDVTPRQLLKIAGNRLPGNYKNQLERYRHGMGVYKVDWALSEPIPFSTAACRQAGTIHLGNTLEEIAASEQATAQGKHPEKPFVLLAQQSLFDACRAPVGKHTAWAYCHVPNGSTKDMTKAIEQQVERFAPGFRDIIMAKSVKNTIELEAYNPNYIGGDINGGIIDLAQLYTRPTLSLSPYRTPVKGLYFCSSSTPPGGGVHGMCGYHAAKTALKDIFKLKPTIPLAAG